MLTAFERVDWLVLLGGSAAIVVVNWYFFLAERGSVRVSAGAPGLAQEVTVVVRGGYDPAMIHVKSGSPVRLLFDRRETSSCSEEVVFPDFGIRTFLPTNATTPVVLDAPAPGTYAFTCGMSMLRGTLVVE